MTNTDEAFHYIKNHCRHMGSYFGDLAPYRFLRRVAEEIASAPHTPLFPERYKEHVAYALGMVAQSQFLDPPAAVGSVYLATRFEFYFRLLSGVLNADGTWVNESVHRPRAIDALGKNGLNRNRVSNVAVTYRLMKLSLDGPRPAAQAFDSLDRDIYSTAITAVGQFQVADIGDRVAFGRHSAGHGHWGDISADAVFYGLVTAVVFYNQT